MAKILVVDDDRVVVFTLAEGLRQAGFDAFEANNGPRALALCQRIAIDLALLDINMPGMDGLELARRLRDETSVACMFLSAYDDENLVVRATEIGALGYLVKPITVPAILPTLRTALALAADIAGLHRTEAGLQRALASNRAIGTAVGVVMAREGLGQQAAFERLRKEARDKHRRLEDMAREMLTQNGGQ